MNPAKAPSVEDVVFTTHVRDRWARRAHDQSIHIEDAWSESLVVDEEWTDKPVRYHPPTQMLFLHQDQSVITTYRISPRRLIDDHLDVCEDCGYRVDPRISGDCPWCAAHYEPQVEPKPTPTLNYRDLRPSGPQPAPIEESHECPSCGRETVGYEGRDECKLCGRPGRRWRQLHCERLLPGPGARVRLLRVLQPVGGRGGPDIMDWLTDPHRLIAAGVVGGSIIQGLIGTLDPTSAATYGSFGIAWIAVTRLIDKRVEEF